MARKLAFKLTPAGSPERYAIDFLDPQQIGALAQAEGCTERVAFDRIVVTYDEGNGELAPADGFDTTTSRGRIAMRILGGVYCNALARIEARRKGDARSTRQETFILQS